MNSQRRPARVDVVSEALHRVLGEICAGLQHGYFEFTVSCEIVSQERRQLVLHAGKSYRFLIPKEDCMASQPGTVIPATGTPTREPDKPRCIADTAGARQAQTDVGLGLPVAHGEQR